MAIHRAIRYVLEAPAPDAEAAMFEYATHIRAEHPGCHWSMFRDPAAPGSYLALVRCTTAEADARMRDSEGTRRFTAAIARHLARPPDETQCDLVTSTDLAPRRTHPPRARSRRR